MIRALFVPGFGTAAFIGYTQATQAWMLQPVAIFGIYGFDFLILLVNYGLALGLLGWYDRKYRPQMCAWMSACRNTGWLAQAWSLLRGSD